MQYTRAYEPPTLRPLAKNTEQSAGGMRTWLVILIFIVITLAGCWSIVVAAVHYRRMTTGMSRSKLQSEPQAPRRGEDDGDEEKRSDWWTWLHNLVSFTAARTREYKAVQTEELGWESEDHARALTSTHDLLNRLQGISPRNPFLTTPNVSPQAAGACRPRGSAEWAEHHRAFFAAKGSELFPSSPEKSSSSHSAFGAELAGVESEAREAQEGTTALADDLTGMVFGRRERSWVDLGLAAVDGAVDRVAAKIVRWTDGGGRDADAC